MISGLSAQILGYLQRHPSGVKFADVTREIRRPVQEIEGALSQLKRQGYAKQSGLGIWEAVDQRHLESMPPRPDREPDLARIPTDLEHLQHRPPASTTTSLLHPTAATIRRAPSASQPVEPVQPQQTEETTMGKRTCEKCKTEKAGQAFPSGDDVCRQCRKGIAPAEKPKPKRKAAKQLRAIVKKHTRRAATPPAAGDDPLLQQLVARRDRLNIAIAALQEGS